MRVAALFLFPVLVAGCAELPGVCEQAISVDGVKYGFCYEVDTPTECPTKESSDDNTEFRWFFFEGGTCEEAGYSFPCGSGLWEDIETDCPEGF